MIEDYKRHMSKTMDCFYYIFYFPILFIDYVLNLCNDWFLSFAPATILT